MRDVHINSLFVRLAPLQEYDCTAGVHFIESYWCDCIAGFHLASIAIVVSHTIRHTKARSIVAAMPKVRGRRAATVVHFAL